MDVYDIICGVKDFRAHIFCPQTTQELPKKHLEARPHKQLPTYALSQVDYRHTLHYKDYKEVRLCQRTMQGTFCKICEGNY